MKMFLTGVLALALGAVSAYAQDQPGGNQRKNRRAQLEQLDKDKDGKISRSEWTGKAKRFNRIDANNDGYVTREELQQARKKRRRNQ